MTNERFSVYQFFDDGTRECVRSGVFLNEAMAAAKHYTSSLAVKMGMVQRVIITDGGDDTVFEWVYGSGVVFPRNTDA